MYQGLVAGLTSAGQRRDQDLRNQLLQQRQQWDEQDRLSRLREEGFLQAVQEVDQLGGLSEEGLRRFNASGRFRATAVARGQDGSQVWRLPDGTQRVMPYARVRELLFRENAAAEKRAEDANNRANLALQEEVSQNAFRNDIASMHIGLAQNEDRRADERMGLAYNADKRADEEVAYNKELLKTREKVSAMREASRVEIEKLKAAAKAEASGRAKGMAERDRLQWFDRYDAQVLVLEKRAADAEAALKATKVKDRDQWDSAANNLLKVEQELEATKARRDAFAPGGMVPAAGAMVGPSGLVAEQPQPTAQPNAAGAAVGGAIGNAFVPGLGGLVGRAAGGMIPTVAQQPVPTGGIAPVAQQAQQAQAAPPAAAPVQPQPFQQPDDTEAVLSRMRQIEGEARKKVTTKAGQDAAQTARDSAPSGEETPDLGVTATKEWLNAMTKTLGRGQLRDVANQAEFADAALDVVSKAAKDVTSQALMRLEQEEGERAGAEESVTKAKTYLVQLAKALGTQVMVKLWNTVHPNDKMTLDEWEELVQSSEARKEFVGALRPAKGSGSTKTQRRSMQGLVYHPLLGRPVTEAEAKAMGLSNR